MRKLCVLLTLTSLLISCPQSSKPPAPNSNGTGVDCINEGDGYCYCAGGLVACDNNAAVCFGNINAPGCQCYNIFDDPTYCAPGDANSCGVHCGDGTCQNGTCVCSNPNDVKCPGIPIATACVNLSSDNGNCGQCGNDCGAGKCINGQCDYTNLQCCAQTPSGASFDSGFNTQEETSYCWIRGVNCLDYASLCDTSGFPYSVSSVNVPATDCFQKNARAVCVTNTCS